MNRQDFFNTIRGGFTGAIEPGEVTGTETILGAMAGQPLAFTAYALATAWHETAGKMQPIGEFGGDAYFFRRYDRQGSRPDIAKALGNTQAGDGVRFHGRGYVQLTGRANYRRASEELGIDLIAEPERALAPDIAAKIMRQGMAEGWFTGKRFASYLPVTGMAPRSKFIEARRIINAQDRAIDIAEYALGYQRALVNGGWA